MPDDHLRILDIRIDNLTKAEALRRAVGFLHQDRLHHIVTVGPEFILEATAHPAFAEALQQADLAIPDGMGLRVGAAMTGQKLKERYPGVDFVHDLLRHATQSGQTVFLYGARPPVVEKAVVTLLRTYPGLKIVGFESGHRGPWTHLHDQRVIEKIHLAKPDILLVALGAPKQELWIRKHHLALHNVKVAIGVGRTFEYLAGTIKRPPAVVRKLGLEWVDALINARKYHDPQHRRQRVFNATWHFLIAVNRRRHA